MDQEIRGVLFDKDGTLLDFERTWTPVSRRCAELVARMQEEGAMDWSVLRFVGTDRAYEMVKKGQRQQEEEPPPLEE